MRGHACATHRVVQYHCRPPGSTLEGRTMSVSDTSQPNPPHNCCRSARSPLGSACPPTPSELGASEAYSPHRDGSEPGCSGQLASSRSSSKEGGELWRDHNDHSMASWASTGASGS